MTDSELNAMAQDLYLKLWRKDKYDALIVLELWNRWQIANEIIDAWETAHKEVAEDEMKIQDALMGIPSEN